MSCKHQPLPIDADAAFRHAEGNLEHGDLNTALNDVNKALPEVVRRDPNTYWRFRLLKAEILIWQGANRDALALLSRQDAAEPSSPVLLARRSTLLGIVETNTQELDLARQTFLATEKMQASNSPEVMGDLLLGEGKLAALTHDPSKSELLFNRALQIAREDGQTSLLYKALGNLGMLQMQELHYADAVDRFNAALAAAQKLGAQTSVVRATVNLGWAYRRMGDLDRASQLFEESEKEAEQLGMITDQTASVMSIAIIRFMQHHFSEADTEYQLALQLARRVDDKQEAVYCLNNLAQVAIEVGDMDRAEKYNNAALGLEQSIGDHDTELYSLENKAQISAGRGDYPSAEHLLRQVVRDTTSNVELQVLALTNLAGLEARRGHFADAKRHHENALESLEKERKSLGRDELKLSYPTNAKDIYSEYIDFLVEHGMPDEAFRVAELQRARTLTDGLGLSDSSSQHFDVAEAERAAARLSHPILSYWVGTKASYLWMVRPDHTQLFVLPPEDRIRTLVEKYRAHLMGAAFDSGDVADASGQELYSILIGPVERWIKPQSQVTIIPDEELCGLNFETLVVSSPKPHYWIEDVSVTNASSAVLLTAGQRKMPAPSKSLLLIGNPVSPPSYPPLSHASDEMRLIQAKFTPAQETLMSGASATPAAYLRAKPENYAFIHFVAHGTASRASPLDSAVVLSDDGKSHNLYARDIAATRLHARLVTISACDSAGNRIYSSEGLVGLSWAFLRAGAQKVIAALWEVNDASTPELMERMYAAIASGEEPAAALRDAKLSLLHSGTVYQRPYYWAPFVLYEGI